MTTILDAFEALPPAVALRVATRWLLTLPSHFAA